MDMLVQLLVTIILFCFVIWLIRFALANIPGIPAWVSTVTMAVVGIVALLYALRILLHLPAVTL